MMTMDRSDYYRDYKRRTRLRQITRPTVRDFRRFALDLGIHADQDETTARLHDVTVPLRCLCGCGDAINSWLFALRLGRQRMMTLPSIAAAMGLSEAMLRTRRKVVIDGKPYRFVYPGHANRLLAAQTKLRAVALDAETAAWIDAVSVDEQDELRMLVAEQQWDMKHGHRVSRTGYQFRDTDAPVFQEEDDQWLLDAVRHRRSRAS